MTKYAILWGLVMLGVLTACEEVISIDYNLSTSQMVIEGNVFDESGRYTVTLSRSVAMDAPSVYPAVTGATVTISDNTGTVEVLTETSAGVYQTALLQGVPGRTYFLTVVADGQTYTASSTMPDAVAIDTLYYTKMPYAGLYRVNIDLTDPSGSENYYRLVDIVNGRSLGNDLVASDALHQGQVINGTMVYGSENLKTGDTLTMWLETIDKGVYTYFNTASQSNQNSTSPANPRSNISNSALGYFNACSVRKWSIVITD